jgi:hypothetical protein
LAILDDFTINGTETLAVAQSKVADLISKGEKLSGNYHAEEFNRFVSARSAHLLGEKLNLNHEELRTLISTFVNRVEGNILASQRPSIFQGPIGKAVGLFQSYQFNLLQQLFRHVGEGSGKDALMLLGLQSSLYGMQGMPAFDLVNQHLIGTASGNIEHRDIYDSTVDVAGKEAAEFMLYGIPSWVLGTNLYTRGDINPRHPTILPFNIVDIPVVAMTGKLFSSMKEGLTKVANGGNAWESALNALEHNGVNRPLAGLAAVLQGHSTTQNGSIAYENDLFSWATATRLAGGKPMDEAILRDALYRKKAYEAFDRQKLLQFRETAKTHVNSGTSPGENQIERLAKLYAESGGNQQQFSKYLLELYRTAPQTEIDKLSQDIKSPLSQKLQLWMDE